jgi:hypothetical protein
MPTAVKDDFLSLVAFVYLMYLLLVTLLKVEALGDEAILRNTNLVDKALKGDRVGDVLG